MTNTTRRRLLRTGALTGVLTGTTLGTLGAGTEMRPATRPAQVAENVSTFRENQQRHGYQPDASLSDSDDLESFELDWRVDGVNKTTYSAAKASPVAAPTGDLIIPGDTGTVYAITPDGETRWATATDPSPNGIHGTPTVTGEAVYIGAYDGGLYAFDVETGEREWKSVVGDFIGSSPAHYDGTIYVAVEFGDPDGSVVAIDAETGELEWEGTEPTNHPHSTLAIDLDEDKLVVGANDGYFYAWHFEDREFAWMFNTGRPIKGPIATYDGSAFFGSWDHNVYRVSLEDGTEEWDRSFTTDDTVMSGPAIDTDDDRLYIGSDDGSLYALDATSGEEVWRFETDGGIIGCPTVTDAHVLFGSTDTNLYVLEKAGGEHVWDFDSSGHVTSTPLVHDGAVYVANRASETDSGGFYRFGESSGSGSEED